MPRRSTPRIVATLVAFATALVLFQTAALARVKIAVWGDSRENRDNATAQIADVLLHKITDWDFQIHTGDFTHRGKPSDWQRTLGYPGIRQLFVRGKFFMCTSNHDDVLATYDRYTADVLPRNPVDHTTHFFSIQRENVHVVFCDQFFTPDSVTTAWLERDLAEVTPDMWLIAVWHEPCYGGITYKKPALKQVLPWLQVLYRHGGDFVLHGHAHVYVRTYPLNPDGLVDQERGMVHIINGTGGAGWKHPQIPTWRTAFTPDTRSFPTITFITIDGHTATVQTVDARPGHDLRVIDQTTLTR